MKKRYFFYIVSLLCAMAGCMEGDIPTSCPVTEVVIDEITAHSVTYTVKLLESGCPKVESIGVQLDYHDYPHDGWGLYDGYQYTETLSGLKSNTEYEICSYGRNADFWTSSERQHFKTLEDSKLINGHEYVDLGLSVKWATMNVGATSPEDYGDYFAWGETKPKSNYEWSTYKWCKGSYDTLTKYCTHSKYGTVDNKTVLDLSDDAARANWGGSWRMPTIDEIEELKDNCTGTWTTQNGVNGYKVTSKKNGNSIFLPAAGYRSDGELVYAGSGGYYWSSALNPSYAYVAYYLFFFSSEWGWDDSSRYYGLSVRAVFGEDHTVAVESVTVSPSTLSLEVGDTKTLTAVVSPSTATDKSITWSSSNDAVATVSQDGLVTAKSAGTATITATSSNGKKATCVVAVTDKDNSDGEHAGHAYVDLGLPSGLKWATCNVGATKPEDYGDYFAWGETSTKSTYNWASYKWCNGSETTLTKYCTVSYYGKVDGKKALDLADDAARANWGSDWRMPTEDEFKELMNNCTRTWITQNGVEGCKVTSKINDKSIFLPAAGTRWDDELLNTGYNGWYWSSSLYPVNVYNAYSLDFYSGDWDCYNCDRFRGNSVRAVFGEDHTVAVESVTVSPSTLSLEVGDTKTLTAVVSPSTATDKSITWSSSNDAVATVSQDGLVTAKSAGTATITATSSNGKKATCEVAVTEKDNSDGEHAGHAYVDLGLPSGVKWATMNVGATKPEGYGDYFAWGETKPKSYYDLSTYKWLNGTTLTKYCTDSEYGKVDGKTVLDLSDDAARANWGGSWRMPTKDEIDELKANCTGTWITRNGVEGCKVTSKINGKSIFLPAAGSRWYGDLRGAGSGGYYWSSSLYPSNDFYAYDLVAGSDYWYRDQNSRDVGQSVRAVCP